MSQILQKAEVLS